MTIVVALLVVYLLGWRRNEASTLAFLTIATGLLGLPSAWSGWQFIARRNGSSSPPPGGDSS